MAHEIDNSEDVIDVRDIIARVEELEALCLPVHNVETGTDEYDTRVSDEERTELTVELNTLRELLDELCGNSGDEQWRGDWYPVTLIRDSYFEDYARELVEDCGYIAKDFPTWIEIDWEATARNVRMDYTSTEFDGVTYWFR